MCALCVPHPPWSVEGPRSGELHGSACDGWIPAKVPTEGLCVCRAAPILPAVGLRGASGVMWGDHCSPGV